MLLFNITKHHKMFNNYLEYSQYHKNYCNLIRLEITCIVSDANG